MRHSQLEFIENLDELAEQFEYDAHALAKFLQVAVRTLRRFIRKSRKMTLHNWLLGLRLRPFGALQASRKSVKQSADLLGFKRSSHFSRVFKKLRGCAPAYARVQQKRRLP